jgi:hypothetical protein
VAATAGGQPQDHADRKQVPHGKWTEELDGSNGVALNRPRPRSDLMEAVEIQKFICEKLDSRRRLRANPAEASSLPLLLKEHQAAHRRSA